MLRFVTLAIVAAAIVLGCLGAIVFAIRLVVRALRATFGVRRPMERSTET